MIAGQLEIQMLANLAQLRQDMDRATSMVDSAMADISKAVNVAKFALGALAGVASVAAFKDMITGAIDAAEALHDLSIQTGASVESLSAMAKVGVTTDTSAQAIAGAMNKLAKNMAVANEESKGTGQALKALGIDFDTFRQLKPDDQMLALAQAMGQFEDGSGKSAVAMTLLGKEGAKMLPFMADLAAAGALVATVTTEQAEQADAYNDAMSVSAERVDEFKRQLALGLLPTMLEVYDLTGRFATQLGDYLGGAAASTGQKFDGMRTVIRALGTVFEALLVLGSDVAFVFQGIGREIGGLAAQAVAFATGNFKQVGAIHDEMMRDAAAARGQLDKFQSSVMGTTDKLLQARDAMRSSTASSSENNREIASLGARYGATALKALDYKAAGDKATEGDKARKAALKELADADDRQSAALLELAGLSKDYGQKVRDLNDLVGKGTISHETYYLAMDKLQAKTPASIQQTKELAAAQKLANDEFDKAETAMKRDDDATVNRIKTSRLYLEQLLQETADLKLTKLELALVTAERKLEKDGVIAGTEAYTAYIAKIRAAVVDKENTTAAIGEMKRIEDAAKTTADNIEKGMIDSLFRAFESGKDFFSTLWGGIKNTFKTEILVPIIKDVLSPFAQAWRSIASQISNTVLSPAINFVTSSLGLGSVSGAANAGTTATSGASSLSSLASLGASAGAFSSGLGAGFSAIIGEAGIAGGISAGMTAIGAGNVAAGMGTLIGAAGPYALAALAAIVIAKKLFGSKGGPKVEGMANTGGFAGIPGGGSADAEAATILGNVQSLYTGTTSALGGTAGAFTGAAFLARDPNGTALTQLVLDAAINGKQVYSRNNRTGGGNVEDVGRDPQQFADAVAAAQTQALLASLKATTFADADVTAALAAIDANASAADISGRIQSIVQAKAAKDAQAAAAAGPALGTGVGTAGDYMGPGVMSTISPTQYDDGVASVRTAVDSLKAEVASLRADNTAENTSMAVLLKTLERILVRVSGGADNPGDALSVRAITP